MKQKISDELKTRLLEKKNELEERLERIGANVRRTLNADSEERARELADQDVVDALGNEARAELIAVNEALERMSGGNFGICLQCGTSIGAERLAARPYAEDCFDCANRGQPTNSAQQRA